MRLVLAIFFVTFFICFSVQSQELMTKACIGKSTKNYLKHCQNLKRLCKNIPKQHIVVVPVTFLVVDENPLGIMGSDIVFGNKDAPVVMIEYSSATCPHCLHYHKTTYKRIKQEYIDTGKVAYIIRNYIANKQDLASAVLAMCNKEKYEAFIDVIYSQEPSWGFNRNYLQVLKSIGEIGGISNEQYESCLDDDNLTESLINTTRSFASQIIGTPSFIINKKLFRKPYLFNEFALEIEQELKNAGK